MGAPYVIGTPKANGLSFYLRHTFCIHMFYLVLHNLRFHGSWIIHRTSLRSTPWWAAATGPVSAEQPTFHADETTERHH